MTLVVKNLLANIEDIRDVHSIPGLGRSLGGGHGNPLQYSSLENPWIEQPGGLQSTGLQRIGHDPATRVWINKIFLKEKKKLDTTEGLTHFLWLAYFT